jgi:2-keto-3-deoxy-L-rhamnonate aldolase RhmA
MLRDGEPVIAVTLTAANVDMAAHAASLGFDFLWIEMEHSPITLETLRNIVLATRGMKALPFARVPVNEIWMAKRVLDAGACGVIFPFTSTPELATQAAAACRYPLAGRRGSGAVLARFSWPGGAEGYADSADRNVVVSVIIEDARAPAVMKPRSVGA